MQAANMWQNSCRRCCNDSVEMYRLLVASHCGCYTAATKGFRSVTKPCDNQPTNHSTCENVSSLISTMPPCAESCTACSTTVHIQAVQQDAVNVVAHLSMRHSPAGMVCM